MKNAEALGVASKENGLEINADKTKYVVMSRDQNTRGTHSIKIGNIFSERVEQFKYLGTTLTNENTNHEEIKISFMSENVAYLSAQNIFFQFAI